MGYTSRLTVAVVAVAAATTGMGLSQTPPPWDPDPQAPDVVMESMYLGAYWDEGGSGTWVHYQVAMEMMDEDTSPWQTRVSDYGWHHYLGQWTSAYGAVVGVPQATGWTPVAHLTLLIPTAYREYADVVICGGLNTTSAYGVDGNVRLARFVYWGPGN
ncbi:MAG: hypothetical protein KBA64_15945 [Armatimonadetes bacterium]|jgi:hypothetical protein|nr:hypothetical protein [Armatimonadota bacterium]MDI9603041.1 hypothetical protein [Acidobacteriota bacterium]